jgi:hypothetical protein
MAGFVAAVSDLVLIIEAASFASFAQLGISPTSVHALSAGRFPNRPGWSRDFLHRGNFVKRKSLFGHSTRSNKWVAAMRFVIEDGAPEVVFKAPPLADGGAGNLCNEDQRVIAVGIRAGREAAKAGYLRKTAASVLIGDCNVAICGLLCCETKAP